MFWCDRLPALYELEKRRGSYSIRFFKVSVQRHHYSCVGLLISEMYGLWLTALLKREIKLNKESSML